MTRRPTGFDAPSCIFGNENQWASVKAINPRAFNRVADEEARSGLTIHRKLDVRTRAARGLPVFDPVRDRDLVILSQMTQFNDRIILPPGEWEMPAGAFKECGGPT